MAIVTADQIKKVLILGNGTMGQNVGVQCAAFGYDVVIFLRPEDPTENEKNVCSGIRTYMDFLVGEGMLSEESSNLIMSKISFSRDEKQACEGIQLVSESVLEDVSTKQAMWSRFAPYFPEDAVLTTNTSSLLPSQFMEATGAPERFLAWHFHTPVFIQNYADVMITPKTDPQAMQTMIDFSAKVNQNCGVLTKELDSFMANNMLFGVFDQALRIYLDGYADFVDIDKAWMGVRVYPIGPFGLMDKIGIPTMRHIYAGREQNDVLQRSVALFDNMIAEGKLGKPNGKGFYTYPNPAFEQDGFISRAKPVL